mgnify:CR=1 FL=1
MKKMLLSLWMLTAAAVGLWSQLGIIDPNFDPGTGFGPDSWTGKCEVVVQQPDGKLLIGGQFTTYNDESSPYLVRLNLDGSRDESFTSPFEQSWGYYVETIALQPDGKILIGGYFDEIAGVTVGNIARINSDGSFDASFDPGSGFNHGLKTIAVQADGKVLVAGGFTIYDYYWNGSQTPVNGFVRLNADGSLDNSFDASLAFADTTDFVSVHVGPILIQPDGKILAGGRYSIAGIGSHNFIARFLSDGSLDTSFDAGNHPGNSTDMYNGMVNDLALLPDGKIYVSGNYVGIISGLDRLNADGSLDASFSVGLSINDHRSYPIAVQPDGKILAARVNFGAPNEAMILERFLSDGTLDSSFPSTFFSSDVTDILVQADGNITLVGYFSYNPTGIMRLVGDSPLQTDTYSGFGENVRIFPNPAKDQLNLMHVPHGSQVSLLDLAGRNLYTSGTIYQETLSVSLSDFNPGIYLIRIENSNRSVTRKLVVGK